MPFVPYSITAGQNPLVQFGGLVKTEFVSAAPGCAFQIRQVYKHQRPDGVSSSDAAASYKGPPLHFHPYQSERFVVEQGRLGIEVDGQKRIVTPKDGVVVGKPGCLHRFWMAEDSVEDLIIIVNASDSANDYQLDRLFLENWYGFRYDSLMHGTGLDWIQMMSIFDAGSHYLPAPAWCPFRRTVGYWGTILVGRWIGGLLGYKPYFREYTTDWEYAAEKMRASFFQRRNVDGAWERKTTHEELMRVDASAEQKMLRYQESSKKDKSFRTKNTEEEPFRLHLVVIGAGLAGLSAAISTRLAGHDVTVLEKVSELREVGAGLQITPNASRLFCEWGIFEELASKAAVPTSLSVRRFDGTRLLAQEPHFQTKILRDCGAPFWDIHRVDLQRAMASRAKALGVNFRLSASVVKVNFSLPAVELESGEVVKGDLVLAADGLWSTARDNFLQRAAPPKMTGDLAYRIILNLGDIQDPDLRDWISNPSVNFWIGANSHAVGYSVRAGEMYNLVLLCPDDLPDNVSKAEGDTEEMKAMFETWDPILRKLLSHVDKVEKWRLMHASELDSWRTSQGTFIMAGDSCHPMLPYLAQGANSSLEDGAVLGRILKYVKSKDEIPKATELYQSVRKDRGEKIARETFEQVSLEVPEQQQTTANAG
ncbi:MAG: hypothetical protein M1825_001517 [Sarcosagium campestre]|nr:MAG: hypothetical protein M1825_001517 [Sarcosagium campestre]